ncbi:MAG: hypothetical protein IPJ65_30050 [Archangiaceae bacterium]|nr:hypothetical protein [Archangiaceae bacterium]
MIALAAAVALVAAQAHYEVRADARLETRARTATFADVGGQNGAAGDAEVTPSLFGAVDNLGGHIALRYAPTLRVREPYNGLRRYEFNNNQTLEANWSREGRPRLYLLEQFNQGRVDLATQTVSTPFQSGVVSQLSIDVGGGIVWPIGKLVSLDTSAGFNYGTGLDTFSLGFLPAQRSWRSGAKLEAQVSRVDWLIGAVDGNHTLFPGIGSNFTTGDAAARWKRQLLSSTALELGLLVGLITGYVPANPDNGLAETRLNLVTPGGDGVITHRINTGPHALTFDAGLRVSPFVDRYLATAYNRGEVSTHVGYVFRERWTLMGGGSVARSLTPVTVRYEPQPTSMFSTFLEARAGYVAPRWWQVDVGGAHSLFVLGQGAAVNNWLVSLALTVHAEGQL